MNKLLLAVVLLSVVFIPAFGAGIPLGTPNCNGLTLDTLITGGANQATGCFVGDKLFSNFGYTSTSNPPGPTPPSEAIPAGSVALQDINSITTVGLAFTGGFDVDPGYLVDMNLNYTVTVEDPSFQIDDAGLQLFGVSFGNGNGFITGSEDWCGNGDVQSGCATLGAQLIHQNINFSSTGGTPSYHVDFSPLVNFVTITKDLAIHGGSVANDVTGFNGVSFSRVNQDYSQTQSTPEPVSMMLMGSGLLMVGVMARKRTKKQ